MKEICRLELKRALRNRGTFIILGIMLLGVFADCGLYHELSRDSGKYAYPDLFILGWLPMDYQFVYGSLFRAMFPLAAAVPHGASYYMDKHSGYIKNICVKVPKAKYYMAKYFVTFAVGIMVVVIPLIVSLMLVLTYLPVLKPQPFAFQGVVTEAFVSVYYSSPILYACIYMVIDGVFGGLAAVASLCISDFVKSRFSVVVLPFAVYLLGGALLEQMNLSRFSIFDMVNPLQSFQLSSWIICSVMIAGILVTFYWFCIKKTREDVL